MEWWQIYLVIFGGVCLIMTIGLPIAFCFLLVNFIAAYFWWGGTVGLGQITNSIYDSVTKFNMIALPLFVLMGEVMFESGVGSKMLRTLDKWLGELPGRLSLLAVLGGTLFATLTGSSMGSIAMLGSVLGPEMQAKGYKKSMILGPIMGSGALAIMIPPSSLAVILGTLGGVSIGKLLIAIIIPGLMLSVTYAIYVIVRCRLQPDLAPSYGVTSYPLSEKVVDTFRYVFPIGLVIFFVIGLMFLGVATPSEAAATGAIGCFVLAALYKKFNWKLVKNSALKTTRVAVMMFMIMASAEAFSQILAYSGASKGMVDFAMAMPVAPIVVIIIMQIVGLILGTAMNAVPLMMITLPVFMPIVNSLHFDPVWFGVIYLLNVEMSVLTPPVGGSLFVMKAVASEDTTIKDVYSAAMTFLYLDVFVMAVMIAFPITTQWLPNLMRGGG